MTRRQHLLSEGIGCCVLIMLAAFGLYRIQFGLDLSDEGMYASSPMRYALGDLPFRDEITNPHRLFDVLLWPAFAFFPDMGLYSLRCISVCILLASALGFYLVYKRFCPAFLAAAAVASTAFTLILVWTPGYMLLGSHLLFLSISLFILAIVSERKWTRRGLAAAGGVAFFGSSLSFFPSLSLLIVPSLLIVTSLIRQGGDRRCVMPSLIYIGVAASLLMIALALFFSLDLTESFLEAHRIFTAVPAYSKSCLIRIRWLAGVYFLCIPFVVIMLGVLFCLRQLISRRVNLYRATIAVILPVAAVVLIANIWTRSSTFNVVGKIFIIEYLIMSTAFAMHIFYYALRRSGQGREHEGDRNWRLAKGILLFSGIVYFMLNGFLSASGPLSSNHAAPLIFGPAVICLSRRSLGAPAAGAQRYPSLPQFCLAALCLTLACLSLSNNFRRVYRDAGAEFLTARFTYPALRGIRSTPERVKAVEETLAFFDGRITPGDYFLAYDECPMFYYLTRTRPAERYVWSSKGWPLSVRQESLQYMTRNNRVPKYCIRSLINPLSTGETDVYSLQYFRDPELDPLNAFVCDNYRVVKNVYPFQILERKDLAEENASR